MYEILYTSTAVKEFSEIELSSLLEEVRSKNTEVGITGMLVYYNQQFIQLLEGEESLIKELYNNIELDPRHTSVERFYDGPIDHRTFSDWSMAFKVLDETLVAQNIPGYESFNTTESPMQKILSSDPTTGKVMFLNLRSLLK